MSAGLKGLIAVLAGVLLLVGFLHSASAVFKLPSVQTVQLALTEEPIRDASYERALRNLQRSFWFYDHRQTAAEIGLLHQNKGGNTRQVEQRDALFDLSREALRHSLRLSPVQPVVWYILAEMAFAQAADEAAAAALDWSMRTAHNLSHLQRKRALLGVALWDTLAEQSRDKLISSIVPTLRRDTELIASIAVDEGVSDDLWRRLRAWEPDGWVIAAEFSVAAASYRQSQMDQFGPGEPDDMRRLLAATSILVTTGLPLLGEAMTVHDYLRITRGEDPVREPESVDDYLLGVLDALLVQGDINRREGEGEALFCMPQQELLNYDLLGFKVTFDSMLEQFERELPSFETLARTRSVGLAALQLLTILHPCDE